MVDAQIKDLPSSEAREVLNQMNERFLPDLDEHQARSRFKQIIDESVNAIFAEFMEVAHRVAVAVKYWCIPRHTLNLANLLPAYMGFWGFGAQNPFPELQIDF